jgi:hypothetical protein
VEVKKDIGTWINVKYEPTFKNKVTYLDDLAYYVYCQPRKNRKPENITTQKSFLIHPKVYKRFYDEAILLIRKEKIEKIKNGSK